MNGTTVDSSKTPYVSHVDDLMAIGISNKVAVALDEIFKNELAQYSELDERAYDALKELNEEGALAVLKQFTESSLQHVQNKSAFLCGIMKIHRRMKAEKEHNGTDGKVIGPTDQKVKLLNIWLDYKRYDDHVQELLARTNYSLDITTGQRRYGGPPPKDVYDGPEPGPGCQVFIGRIPRDVFEDVLVPLIEPSGTIWDFRLMMDPLSGQNRGFGFATFTTKEAALECVKLIDNYELRPKKHLGVCVSQSNCRLFVGSIPKSKTKQEIFDEFDGLTQGLHDVIIYLQTEDKSKNRGFCFLEYKDHKDASQARRRLSSQKMKAFGNPISVDWADPIEEPSEEIMAKVKVLYVKNLALKATEENLTTVFSAFGDIERVKKMKDYAFVHFKDRDNAMQAMNELNGLSLEGEAIEISLAKPVDKKRKEKQMERKMMTFSFGGGQQGGYNNNSSKQQGAGRGRAGNGYHIPHQYGGYHEFAGDFYGGFGGYGADNFYGGGFGYGMGGGYRNMHGAYGRGMYGGGRGARGGRGQRGRGGYGAPSRGGRGTRGGSGMNGKRDYVMVMS